MVSCNTVVSADVVMVRARAGYKKLSRQKEVEKGRTMRRAMVGRMAARETMAAGENWAWTRRDEKITRLTIRVHAEPTQPHMDPYSMVTHCSFPELLFQPHTFCIPRVSYRVYCNKGNF